MISSKQVSVWGENVENEQPAKTYQSVLFVYRLVVGLGFVGSICYTTSP